MSYINPSAGTSGAQVTLKIYRLSKATDTTGLDIPGLQNITMNNANDVFTWTQLDSAGKKQIATTSTNSLAMNLVVDEASYFGTGSGTTAAGKGIFGLSKEKTKVEFELNLGDNDDASATKVISGSGYITGLAPTVSADSPVWVSPITITVTGDYTVTDA